MNITSKKIVLILMVLAVSFTACYQETAILVESSFETAFSGGDESVPVQLEIRNQSTEADTFEWTFIGATPATSTDENPGTIVYTTQGTYTIELTVSNIDGSTDTTTKEITVFDNIAINFMSEIIESNFPPVELVLSNSTDGEGLSYLWTFEGGVPATSTEQNPPNVIFESPGEHLITLMVSNGFESFSEETTITVTPDIEAVFDWNVDFFDDDYQAPVTISTTNSSISATSYNWTFPSGTPAIAIDETTSVTFDTPGTYTIELEADNGKQTDRSTRDITILPNTNIRSFTDIELGINTAHNNNLKGAFFSTTLREVFKADEVTSSNGGEIDIAFFGLNNNFNFNKFISPDEAASNGFIAIPNATHTKFINSQEICDCTASLTPVQFDNSIDDSLLDPLTITETSNGLLQFDNSTLPRIVLFETEDGRKGAIKIKDFIDDGANSFIVCDIKVQKLSN